MIRTRGQRNGPQLGTAILAAFGVAVILAGVVACGSGASPTVYVDVPTFLPTPTSSPSPSPTPQPVATPDSSFTPWVAPSPAPTPATGTWTYNLYNARAVRWQDPDMTACTATSAQMMLNMAVYWKDYAPLAPGQADPAQPETWKPTVTYDSQEAILAYERKNTTQTLKDGGADAHGWRNALNYFGWGHNSSMIFSDLTFPSFDAASRAVVEAIALYRKPVGILAWAGQHAQIVTGYKVTGEDPRTGSTRFQLVGVYVTDPLAADGYRNTYVTRDTWGFGGKKIKFVSYQMTNSPYIDPIDGHQGNAEWDGKWVIVAPVA